MPKRKWPVVWSPEAEQDLLDIWDYFAREAAPEIADRRLREIHRACRRLTDLPQSAQPRDELGPGWRSIPVLPHVVFYRLTEEAVEIVRVVHGHRDVDAIFKDEPRSLLRVESRFFLARSVPLAGNLRPDEP